MGVFWQDRPSDHRFSPLRGHQDADVAVVGAGVTGLTTALLLALAGRRVIVLERHQVASGDSLRSTAHLTELPDVRPTDLRSQHPREAARLVLEGGRAAIEEIERIARSLNLECGFKRVNAYLFASNRQQFSVLHQEWEALNELGVMTERLSEAPLPFAHRGAIRFAGQARVHPLHYLQGILSELVRKGVRIHEQTPVLDLQDGEPAELHTPEGHVYAREIVIATHVPILRDWWLQARLSAYRTYVVAAPLRPETLSRIAPFSDALFWDLADPYHYLRLAQVADSVPCLLAGGEDHRTGTESNTLERVEWLAQYLRRQLGIQGISHRWSGQIYRSFDGLPLIGRPPGLGHLRIATGYAGAGMTLGTLAALIISDQILGRRNPWGEVCDPTRVHPLTSAREILFMHHDYPITLLRDHLPGLPGGGSLDKIFPGEGRVIKISGRKVAAYRDPLGSLHLVSADATPLGCQVRWNALEKSWDCPCTGTRYSPDGDVLSGPAITGLPLVRLPRIQAA